MSKNISISDEVYDRLVREKGDRSFSEVIAAKLDSGGQLMDVTGNQVLKPAAIEAANREIDELGEHTLERLRSNDEAV